MNSSRLEPFRTDQYIEWKKMFSILDPCHQTTVANQQKEQLDTPEIICTATPYNSHSTLLPEPQPAAA
eukprot:scaffold67762_cov22-Tisochrysis_lutea.AAC.1